MAGTAKLYGFVAKTEGTPLSPDKAWMRGFLGSYAAAPAPSGLARLRGFMAHFLPIPVLTGTVKLYGFIAGHEPHPVPSPVISAPRWASGREVISSESSPPNRMDVKIGSCADAWSVEVTFDSVVIDVEVMTWNEDMEIVLVDETGVDMPARTVVGDGFWSDKIRARGFKHRNKVPGAVATFEVTGAWEEV